MATLKVKADLKTAVKRAPRLEWTWIALACLLLGVSGGIRYFRDWRFLSIGKESEHAPFPLAQFPEKVGTWNAVPGTESSLEPDIARIAGANDHLIRTYVDEKSGEEAVVMILYGLAYLVWPHTPDTCYPPQGFPPAASSRNQDIDLAIPGSPNKARFREQHFAKSIGGQVDYRVVYHSFFYRDKWDYDVEKNWKAFRYHPGMFKVQVQRRAGQGSKTEEGAFLELLTGIVQEIERRLPASP